ncbi:MAG: 3-deoxy-manno-octulosonate cytidylyltransferase [Alphaproteobacteria bacterium]|nr:3-deoxy-manno-octulosonate cytidylyltransferase [Alphaproteobacteria bacterium]
MNPIILIPARLASTRLPDKPLATIGDAPMIVQVWRRATEADIGPVVVAAADTAIVDAVTRAGGRAVSTRPDHPSGSDRIFEALQTLDPRMTHDVVVNVQGDLPLLDPRAIRSALAPLADPACDIATLAALLEAGEIDSRSVVKLWADFGGKTIARARAFSRAATPPPGGGWPHHHIGLYAYRRAALTRFVARPPSAAEKRENLEQLRALDAGMRIDAALVDAVPFGVDTPADLERARALMRMRPDPARS